MNALTPFHGITIATAGRPDIRAMTRHYTAPFGAAEPFVEGRYPAAPDAWAVVTVFHEAARVPGWNGSLCCGPPLGA